MKLKTVSLFLVLALVLVIAGCSSNSSNNSSTTKTYSLKFDVKNYTEKTKTVTTSDGKTEQVTYRYYQNIVYVANPVDSNYESMNVSVPTKVNGVAIDAKNAPILFNINVGGYHSSQALGGASGGASTTGGTSGGTPPSGSPPTGASNTGSTSGGTTSGGGGGAYASGMSQGGSQLSDLALAAGYVVVDPGCRGIDNKASDGTYYGKAPAAIVDLKSAVRYIRYNTGAFPGNNNWIISSGGSAGGALSTLLAASGNNNLYDSYFKQIGAANAADNIYASCSFSPITDLEHADGAYEWEFGTIQISGKSVDQTLSQQLRKVFTDYQAPLNLKGENNFGTITADNYGEYLLRAYLIPSANKYLSGLSESERATYLSRNQWIAWKNNSASFTFADFVTHVGRMKSLPAFDSFDLGSTPETELFGNKTTDARHFTEFSLRQTTSSSTAQVDTDVKTLGNLMNPMYFVENNNSGCANYWWIRNGTIDNNTAHTVAVNLATLLENKGKNVNAWLYWDGGHAVDQDPQACIAWIGKITGFTK